MIVRWGAGRWLFRRAAGVLGVVVILGMEGCRSTARPAIPLAEWKGGVAVLARPLTGDLAALYRLTVKASGGLRLSVLTHGRAGRLTISEPFGSAISLAAWGRKTELFDLRHGCRMAGAGERALFFGGRVPLAELARLLGGRLPAVAGDRMTVLPGGRLIIRGHGWSCTVRLAHDPWRVTEVDGPADTARPRWRIRLGRHTSSLPGFLRAEWGHGEWAELELSRLQWNTVKALPPLPAFPPCGNRE